MKRLSAVWLFWWFERLDRGEEEDWLPDDPLLASD
jgi:hypothetical protein